MNQRKQVAAAGAFIFDKNERVFLAKFRNKFNQQWSIPGGKLDFGESSLEAVIREVKEETNIDISSPEFFEHGTFVVNDTHVIYVDYIADCPETFEVKINDEFSEWGFFAYNELDSLDIIPKTKTTVLAAMRHRSKKKWVEHLTPYNLGLIRKAVHIFDPQSNWGEAYTWVREQILGVLKTSDPIEHIGSTSISNLPAKPVLDILLVFSDAGQFKKDIVLLEELGFSYKGDGIGKVSKTGPDEHRHFFSYYNCEENIDYVHLHALPKGHEHIQNLLKFRDRLRASKELTEEYGAFKNELRRNGLSRHDYTVAKDTFVAKVLGGVKVLRGG